MPPSQLAPHTLYKTVTHEIPSDLAPPTTVAASVAPDDIPPTTPVTDVVATQDPSTSPTNHTLNVPVAAASPPNKGTAVATGKPKIAKHHKMRGMRVRMFHKNATNC
jgi:hypothetical protein